MTVANSIFDILKKVSFYESTLVKKIPLFEKINEKINKDEKLIFLLPAFPAKSPSRLKTCGTSPDFGEVLALENLNNVCNEINKIYEPGAQVIICSDGRVFAEVVNVSDEKINEYQRGIEKIVKDFKLENISLFTLDNAFEDLNNYELRTELLTSFGREIEEIKHIVKTQDDFKNLFNGMHRFLLEDEMALNTGLSKNQLAIRTKAKTYELMRRSEAWTVFLSHHFKDHLRLSIHPYEMGHEKFGIKLVQSSSKWATPWHNVTVKIKNTFELMHLSEALKLNATQRIMGESYVYFEVSEV